AVLRELTEILPSDAWVTYLALDAKGVELTGQAGAASNLIPLLENSPRLERVEFASPVTRGRDREQFRIRAAGEAPAPPAPAAELESTTTQFDKLAEGFLTSATPAVAASELQKIVKDMAAQAKTEVRSERILPPADRGELLEIPVEIAVSCEIRQLVDLLARLDGATKLLPVQDLKVRVVNLSQPKELLVTLTISGFILPNAPGKAKS